MRYNACYYITEARKLLVSCPQKAKVNHFSKTVHANDIIHLMTLTVVAMTSDGNINYVSEFADEMARDTITVVLPVLL